MRLSTLALMTTPALALPNYLRLSNGPSELASNLATHAISSTQAWLQDAVSNTRSNVQKGWKGIQDGLDQELKVENIDKDGIECKFINSMVARLCKLSCHTRPCPLSPCFPSSPLACRQARALRLLCQATLRLS